jgi:hypothetical protein
MPRAPATGSIRTQLPPDAADEVDAMVQGRGGGFGSVRVEATIGATSWRTSLLPDSRRGAYLLPVEKSVRTAEGLSDGSSAHVALVVHVPRTD